MKISDAIVQSLSELGVRYVFGVSGANIEHLHDAIYRVGEKGKIQSVMAKHESGAAFMADAYARMSGNLGVCCATSGGGMMNLIAGVAESHMESVPLLAIVGQIPQGMEGKGGFQDSSGFGRSVDGEQLWGAVAKYVAKIKNSDDFWPSFNGAIEAALSGRPGPAVLLIPRDVYDLEVDANGGGMDASLRWHDKAVALDAGSMDASLRWHDKSPYSAKLYKALEQAKSPVLVVGQGVSRSSQADQVRLFAQKTGMPAVTTMSSLGDYPNQAPNYLGVIGMAGHPSAHRYIREEADLILVAGTGLSLLNRGPLGEVMNSDKAYFVNIDTNSLKAFPGAHLIEAEVGEFFRILNKDFLSKRWQISPGYRKQVYKPILSELPDNFNWDGDLLQSRAIQIAQKYLPKSGGLVFDAGNCAAAAIHYSTVPQDTKTLIALGMGGMGYSFGGAIGSQLALQAKNFQAQTVVFAGDGAFLMSGMEVHTAVDLKLPILFLIFNNNQHGMCTTRQSVFFDDRFECVSYPSIYIDQIAKGFGGPDRLFVRSVSSEAELEQSFKDYQKESTKPGVIDLRISKEQMPPFVAFLPPDAEIINL